MNTLRGFLWCVVLGCVLQASAQQLPLYNAQAWMRELVNPAYTTESSVPLMSLYARRQWLGFSEGPFTLLLHGVHQPVERLSTAGMLIIDRTGPLRYTELSATTAYTLNTGNDHLLRAGIAIAIGVLTFRGDLVTPYEEPDPTLTHQRVRDWLPEVNAGLSYLRKEKWQVGIAIQQVAATRAKLNFKDTISTLRHARHIYLTASYTIHLGGARGNSYSTRAGNTLMPEVLIKYVPGAPPQVEALLWGSIAGGLRVGAVFRTGTMAGALVGLNYRGRALIGYSFDITLNNLGRNAAATSHDLLLRVALGREWQIRTSAPRW